MKKNTSSAFTLIELLTVIAIIGILAAILIPVVGQVRDQARQAKCLSNMRQINLAIFAYHSDHNLLPGPTLRGIWNPNNGLTAPNHLIRRIEDYLPPRSEIWECPSNEAAASANEARLAFLLNNRSATNPSYFFGHPDQGQTARPRPMDTIVAAAQTGPGAQATSLSLIWMISDIDGLNYNSSNTAGGTFALPRSVLPPHNGGRNYVFFAGNAEHRSMANFPAHP
jgi:prepilin-type N-terminal cleavage/methylation domain-containing protein